MRDRFWSKVAISEPDSCWLWKAGVDPAGYGRFAYKGRNERAHRLALILSGQKPPFKKACALHGCDNTACVNPRHLRWGTQADNMKDRASRGRCNMSPLTEKDVYEIRASNCNQYVLADRYGVSQSAISLIKRGKSWRHLLAT